MATEAPSSNARIGRLGAVMLVVFVVCLVGAFVGNRLLSNHQNYETWSWSVHSPTKRVTLHGRHYDRVDSVPQSANFTKVSTMPDGKTILGSTTTGDNLPVFLIVQTSRVQALYGIVGGP